MAGRPEDHLGEVNKVCVVMTKTGLQGLNTLAQALGVSRSEFMEQIGRGLIPILPAAG